eukprot:gnl/TRDRNA2_/TRDRNA2_82427_c1_seq1.p1 gnl/TRDRNA2_/TRDRNA2_82427_c1~~gnl/TRDRNA2_/TRDRNA2_82427_c1_seq1.p1  ORF type:complete len:239 (+),score=51.54 gnl/TRDRNA2_/TRDRNA2_82427_c1_seq1:2-718(+)
MEKQQIIDKLAKERDEAKGTAACRMKMLATVQARMGAVLACCDTNDDTIDDAPVARAHVLERVCGELRKEITGLQAEVARLTSEVDRTTALRRERDALRVRVAELEQGHAQSNAEDAQAAASDAERLAGEVLHEVHLNAEHQLAWFASRMKEDSHASGSIEGAPASVDDRSWDEQLRKTAGAWESTSLDASLPLSEAPSPMVQRCSWLLGVVAGICAADARWMECVAKTISALEAPLR